MCMGYLEAFCSNLIFKIYHICCYLLLWNYGFKYCTSVGTAICVFVFSWHTFQQGLMVLVYSMEFSELHCVLVSKMELFIIFFRCHAAMLLLWTVIFFILFISYRYITKICFIKFIKNLNKNLHKNFDKNCDKILYKNFDEFYDNKFDNNGIYTFVFFCTCTLLENLPSFTIGDTNLLKNYLIKCSHFKNSYLKIILLKSYFSKVFERYLSKVYPIKIQKVSYIYYCLKTIDTNINFLLGDCLLKTCTNKNADKILKII